VESQPSPVQSRLVAGRYRLLSPLGSGGMGTVWRAEDVVLGREVAVKEVTFPHGLSDEDREVLRERTRREARAAARLDHPSAVTVFDVVEEGDAPFLVMELVEARTLSQVVRTDGPLSPRRTAQVGLALLGALETAHAQGIVHRDVKPGNVLLCGDTGAAPGRVVLTDFGIASSPGDSSITSTGLLLGSPSYIAPERARGLPPGPASDLWSLGATLFTAVEGRPPFDAGEPLLTVTAVVTGEHAPFVAAGPLERVLEGLLERDPERRLDAAAARTALLPVATSGEDEPATTAMPRPDAERRAERTSALPMREVRQAAVPGAAGAAAGAAGAAAAGAAAREPASGAGSTTVGPAPTPRTEPGWERPPRVVPAQRRGARRGPLVLAGIVLLAALAGLGFALAGDRDGDQGTDRTGTDAAAPPASAPASPDGSGAPTPSAQSSPSPSGSPTPSAAPIALPAGWTAYTDPAEGWTIGVPPGYERSDRGGLVQFRDDATRRTLRVDFTDDPKPSALAAWQAYSPQLATALTNYQELRLEQVEYKGLDAADLEFTYEDGTTLRVLDRTFVAADGEEAFALYWQVPAESFEQSLPVFEQIAATFQPGP
jgi:hypothetical protein